MNNRFALCLGLFTVSCLIASCGAFAENSPVVGDPPLNVLVSLQNPSVCVGEPIALNYCIINKCHRGKVVVKLGKDYAIVQHEQDRLEWLDITVTDASGRRVPKRHTLQLPPQGGFGSGPYQDIKERGFYSGTMVLGRDYLQPSPGEYRIMVTTRIPTKIGESTEEQTVSAQYILLLKVTKPDPQRVKGIIAQLDATIRNSTDWDRVVPAIQSMFSIPQEQALGAWKSLALNPSIDDWKQQFITHELFRIGTVETAHILSDMQADNGLQWNVKNRADTALLNVQWAWNVSLGVFRYRALEQPNIRGPVLVTD